jgi:hypothetical protein
LLDDQNLPTEDHRRLTRLLGQAETCRPKTIAG